MTKTISEIATALSADNASVNGFVRTLEARGILVHDGTKKSQSGKGKGSKLYRLADDASDRVQELLDVLKG